jgi:hypothetical protein
LYAKAAPHWPQVKSLLAEWSLRWWRRSPSMWRKNLKRKDFLSAVESSVSDTHTLYRCADLGQAFLTNADLIPEPNPGFKVADFVQCENFNYVFIK